MPELPPPRDQSKPSVFVWCPGRRRWLRAEGPHLGWFADQAADLQQHIRDGSDRIDGNGDPTLRTPLDHLRVELANLTGALAHARRRLEDAEKKRAKPGGA